MGAWGLSAWVILAAPLLLQERAAGITEPPHEWDFWLPSKSAPDEEPGHYAPADVLQEPDAAVKAQTCTPTDTSKGYFNVTRPRMYSFMVPKARQMMIVVPGGGGDYLAWEKEGVDVALWLNSLGISAFVLKYRVPRRPWRPSTLHDAVDPDTVEANHAAVFDLQRAIKVVRSFYNPKSPSWRANPTYGNGWNPDRLGVIGFGYGASVIKTLTAQAHYAKEQLYDRICDADDASSLPYFQILVYPEGWGGYVNSPRLRYEDPASAPRSLLMGTWDDKCSPVSDATLYYEQLLNMTDINEFHMFPDGGSGYGTCSRFVADPEGSNSMCSWKQAAKLFVHLHVLRDGPRTLDFLFAPMGGLPSKQLPSPLLIVGTGVAGFFVGSLMSLRILQLAARKRVQQQQSRDASAWTAVRA